MKETIQEQLARKNQAKEVQPKNEKVTLTVMDKRGKTPEVQRTGVAASKVTNRMSRNEYKKMSGAREFN